MGQYWKAHMLLIFKKLFHSRKKYHFANKLGSSIFKKISKIFSEKYKHTASAVPRLLADNALGLCTLERNIGCSKI